METVIDIARKVAEISNAFEDSNSELKRKYLIRNIFAFNFLVSKIEGNCGSFGTGYPFYALKPNLEGKLPIISEQIRYNNQLSENAMESKRKIWGCRSCLSQNYATMPDLKQVCKPCPDMDNELKPRKFINRLPDTDMWMVCEDGHLKESSEKLESLLDEFGLRTSDVDPIQTIEDMQEIADNLKNGIMPKKFLPIDAHIIEFSKIKELIEQVPSELQRASISGDTPYLPIHPLSYRKEWQYDDEPYNFVYDFLAAFTEYNFVDKLKQPLEKTRRSVARTYSSDQLFEFLLKSATDATRRRYETKELRTIFEDRIASWDIKEPEIGKGKVVKNEQGEDEGWEIS